MADEDEIERRWLLLQPPQNMFDDMPSTLIEQGYVPVRGAKIRLRSASEATITYFITMKKGKGVSRRQWEEEIPAWVFLELWPASEGQRLKKVRVHIPHGDHIVEFDVFQDALTGLFLLECEFHFKDEAAAFTLPEWANGAIEVTDDPRYTNAWIALHGIPTR
ncbi:MAG: adenylate cyclase [bacterium]|nr:adenylate cyclase [bacterium]